MSNTVNHKLIVTGANPELVFDVLATLFRQVGQEFERTQATLLYDCEQFFPNRQIAEASRTFPDHEVAADAHPKAAKAGD